MPSAFARATLAERVAPVSKAFPVKPIVGYERGIELGFGTSADVMPVGRLRVWHLSV